MQEKAVVDQRASDAELILMLHKTQKEIELHGESNELNLLLHDFVRELLKQHLLRRVEFPADVVGRVFAERF